MEGDGNGGSGVSSGGGGEGTWCSLCPMSRVRVEPVPLAEVGREAQEIERSLGAVLNFLHVETTIPGGTNNLMEVIAGSLCDVCESLVVSMGRYIRHLTALRPALIDEMELLRGRIRLEDAAAADDDELVEEDELNGIRNEMARMIEIAIQQLTDLRQVRRPMVEEGEQGGRLASSTTTAEGWRGRRCFVEHSSSEGIRKRKWETEGGGERRYALCACPLGNIVVVRDGLSQEETQRALSRLLHFLNVEDTPIQSTLEARPSTSRDACRSSLAEVMGGSLCERCASLVVSTEDYHQHFDAFRTLVISAVSVWSERIRQMADGLGIDGVRRDIHHMGELAIQQLTEMEGDNGRT